MKAIVTVIGNDKVGIIAKVSTALFNCNANILDINQTVMQEYFTMVMLVDIENCSVPFETLSARLGAVGEELGLSVRIQREDIFAAMHRI